MRELTQHAAGELRARLETFLRHSAPLLVGEGAAAGPTLSATSLQDVLQTIRPHLHAPGGRGAVATDIWRILDLGRNEVQTARVLTWLLDPRGSHQMGDAYLKSFWARIGEDVRPFELVGARNANRETVPLGDSRNRIDIEVEGSDFVLFIEVKIDAPEGIEQIQRYWSLAKTKAHLRGKSRYAVVFLAPFVPFALPENCFHLRWNDVHAAIQMVHRLDRNADPIAANLASSFAEHVRRL